jgi:hypothetical protein
MESFLSRNTAIYNLLKYLHEIIRFLTAYYEINVRYNFLRDSLLFFLNCPFILFFGSMVFSSICNRKIKMFYFKYNNETILNMLIIFLIIMIGLSFCLKAVQILVCVVIQQKDFDEPFTCIISSKFS